MRHGPDGTRRSASGSHIQRDQIALRAALRIIQGYAYDPRRSARSRAEQQERSARLWQEVEADLSDTGEGTGRERSLELRVMEKIWDAAYEKIAPGEERPQDRMEMLYALQGTGREVRGAKECRRQARARSAMTVTLPEMVEILVALDQEQRQEDPDILYDPGEDPLGGGSP